MLEQELMKAAYRERMREAARIARRSEAQAQQSERPSSRGGRPAPGGMRLSLPSIIARALWSTPAITGRRDASR